MKRHLTILLAGILACLGVTSFGQTCTGNLLTNPGFENNLNNWNPQGNVTTITSAHSGTKAARLGGTGYASIGQAFPTTAGTSYTATLWARNVGAVEMRFLNASWQQIPGAGTSAGPTSSTYQELTMTKIAPVGAVYVYLIAWKDGSQTIDVDDFCLMTGSSANYPDLVPSNLTVPATITHGTAFTYSFIAKNNGTAASAATSFSVEILGYEVARLPLQALQPGQQVTITKTMTLPQNFLYGGSSMSVKLDLADDLVQELQENNNEVFAPLQVNQGTGGLNLSDLTPSNLVALPANGTPQNTSASVNFTISNLGTAPIFANPLNPATQNHVNSVYLSTNNLLDASDILLENSAVPMVTPIGSINNLSIVFTVPNGTPVGSYFLIVKLDGDQQVPEQNENNNTASIPFTVTAGTGPCTVVATLEAVECYDNQSPNDPTDDQYCVTLNVTYTGTGCSPYFTYNQENFTYGSSITVCGFPANGVSPVLLLHDSANPAAQTTVTATPPAGCLNTALPDLTLTDLQVPATVVAGSSFTANIIVRNIGTAASVPTGLLFYLGSQNPATITVPAIPAGGQLSYSPSISTSPNYTGPASLQAKIDQLGNVNIESNENNNEIGAAFNITSGGGGGSGQIDLSLALQQLTASPAQWSNYPVKLTISNAGPQAATGVKVKFAKPTGVVYVGGNEFTASQGSFNPNGDEVWTVGSIPANGSATLTVNYFLLAATAPVAYAQVTAANETDSDSQPNNGTPPTPVQDDEASTSGGTPPPAADFVATPSSIISFGINQISGSTPSRRFGFNFVGQNTGTAVPVGPGATPVTVGFYLSSDNALSTSDYALGTFTLSSSNGITFGNQADLQPISDNVPGGTYYLIAKMDDGNLFAEPNETNNVAVYGQQVVLPTVTGLQPDLTLADLQIPTASVVAGAILNYNFDASNAGTTAVPGNFTIKSYISTDQTLSANDVQDGNINTGNYAAGFSVQNVAGASTIPANLAAGQYYLIVKIDGDNAIAEGNENNNTVVKPFTVTAPSTGNCELILSPTPMICAAPMANGDMEVGFYAQGPTPYQRAEYSPNGSLVNTLPQTSYPATPAFVLSIENGSIVERNTNANGAITWQVAIPASIISQYNPTVVCRQTGTFNLFLGGQNASGAVCLKVNENLSVLGTLQLPFGIPVAIAPTSWGGAAFVTSLGETFPQGTLGGNIYGVSGSMALLYTKSTSTVANAVPTGISILPCGTDVFRVSAFGGFGHAGVSVNLNFDYDWQFGPQSAQLMRERYTGNRYTSPLPVIEETVHVFYNADGTKWRLTRRIQAADPQYNVPGTDGIFYEKLSATDQVLLTETLDKTKFDALSSLQIYAVAELQPGKLAFFGNKGGAAWYYNPFCNTPVCNLSVAKTAAVCNNSGTPNNAGDDTFTFSFTPMGAAGQWVAFVPNANSNGTNTTYTGQNGETRTLTYSIGSVNQFLNGTVNIGFQDSQNVGCTASIAVAAPATCSNGGGTPDCSTITFTPGVGKITIAGFSSPHVLIKVFKPNWTVAYECLDGQCATPTVVTGLGTGNHFVEVKLMNATWGEICKKTQTVGVTNIAQQDDDRMRLSFDRIYPNPTAYQTTMELYSPVAQQATLDFYDRTGRLVHTQKVELEQGQNLIEQLVFDWKSGTYNVVARGEKTGLPAYGRFLKVWEE